MFRLFLRPGRAGHAAVLFATCLSCVACSSGQKESRPPVAVETAEDEIRRISDVWEGTLVDSRLLSPPSKLSVKKETRTSRLVFEGGKVAETLVVNEELELRSGARLRCRTTVEHQLGVRYGRRQGEPAVELVRPPLALARSCDGIHPEGNLTERPLRALFVLRSDRLVVVEPALDDRYYLPQAN